MANPSVNKGHVRIANDLWCAWMRTGSLKERLFKAIVWECWGDSGRRKAKQPVAITRGRLALLTGIINKSKISTLTEELARDKVILKWTDGPLATPSYWPNQDYDQWTWSDSMGSENETSSQIVTSTQTTPVTSTQMGPSTSTNSVTPPPLLHVQTTSSGTARDYDHALSHPIVKTYVNLFYLGGTQIPRTRRFLEDTLDTALDIEQTKDYTRGSFAKLLIFWRQRKHERYKQKHGGKTAPLSYIAEFIVAKLAETEVFNYGDFDFEEYRPLIDEIKNYPAWRNEAA